jgi:uncharacterized protein (TIGR02284 family)
VIGRDPVESALNEIHVALLKAADHYQHSASIADEPGMAALFRELASKRQQQAETLQEHIRQVGLPRMPDPEQEMVGNVFTRVKAALSEDPEATLVQSQQPLEQAIAQAAVAALQEDLRSPTRQFVHGIVEDVISAQDRLALIKHPP